MPKFNLFLLLLSFLFSPEAKCSMPEYSGMDDGGSYPQSTFVNVVDKSNGANTKRGAHTRDSSKYGYSNQRKDSSSVSSSSSSSSSSFESVDSTGFLTERAYPNGVSLLANQRPEQNSRPEVEPRKTATKPRSKIECTNCGVNSQEYKGHSRFEYREGCLLHRCICHCDGSHDCPVRSIIDMCERENRENPNCKTCTVQGREIKGNSYFDLTETCTLFKNCICRCNGSFECSDQRSENLCPNRAQQVQPDQPDQPVQPVQPDQPVQPVQPTLPPRVEEQCQRCFVHGKQQNGNTRFTHVDDCIEYDCDCFCNGEWACPGERAQNICDFDDEQEPPSLCSECEVNGEFFEGNSKFKQISACKEYTCNCHCDGTYDCPAHLEKNTCIVDDTKSCSKCEISETESYPGESNFTITKECIHYLCTCSCDGSWKCPGVDARNICKGEKPGGCRNCEVSTSEYYPGGTNFTLSKGCIGYTCQCNCNGSWSCPGKDARDTCKGEVVGGCKSCILSDREHYPGDTDFEMKRGCILYKCRCKCDGGWTCPGYKAKDICNNPEYADTGRREQCIACAMSNGENHQPNTQFKMERGCYQYQCTCNCDGSYECPPDTAVNICDVSPDKKSEFRERQEREFQRQRVREQMLMREQQQRQAYAKQREREEAIRTARRRYRIDRVNTHQEQERNRIEMGRTQRERIQQSSIEQDDIVPTRRIPTQSLESRGYTKVERTHIVDNTTDYTQPCLKCSFAGETHPGNTKFVYKRGCYSYQCSCDCNGRWNCDRENITYTCKKTRDSSAVRRMHSQTDDSRRKESATFHVQASSSAKTETSAVTQGTATDTSSSRVQPQRRPVRVYPDTSSTGSNYYRSNKIGHNVNTGNTAVEAPVQIPRQVNPFLHSGYKQQPQIPEYQTIPISRNYNYHSVQRTKFNTQPSSSRFVFPATHNIGSRQIQTSRTLTFPVRRVPHSAAGANFPTAMNYPSGIPTGAMYPASESSVNTDSCQRCLADGKYYNVNELFDMNRNCVVYKCRCMCNGNYRCAITPNPMCSSRSVEGKCGNCHVDGLIYPGNMGFQQRKKCHEYTCQCRCNGTYDCPEEKRVNLCPSNEPAINSPLRVQSDCAMCDIEGQTYVGNSQFKIYHNCLVYNCVCDCKGSFKCSGEHAPGCLSTSGAVTVGYPDIRKTQSCSKCQVKHESYSPNSNFTLTQGCLEYNCHCNCDGTWFCPSQSPKQVCDARAILKKASSCESCDVRGTVYPVDATFVLREGCHQHTCICNCDGTWRCPVNTTINVCESKSSPSNGGFRFQYTSTQNQNSDSSRSTSNQNHGLNSRSTSNGYAGAGSTSNDLSGCKTCTVNGKTYLSNLDFKFREGCTQYKCKCFCNGTWECPTEQIENVCPNQDYRIDGCKECLVKNQTYPGGSPFTYRDGCWEYNCMCACDGKWSCPAGRSFDLCKSKEYVSSRCRPCIIQSKVIRSKSSFNLRQGCKEYLCDCGCDGNWTCPEDRSINTCELEGQPGVSATDTVTKGCTIGNKTYYRRIFGYKENCVQYTCICFDNGAWRCPPNKSKKVC